MASKTVNKGVAWLYSEVCALLDIWADQDIQLQLSGRLHNMCIYEKISKRLCDLGIDRTGEQCREKIKKLRRDYKTVVDNNYSPAFARKLLGCYDKVHEIFGKCAIVKPSFVIESIVYNEECQLKADKEKELLESDMAQVNKTKDESSKDSTENSKEGFVDANKNSATSYRKRQRHQHKLFSKNNAKGKSIQNHFKKHKLLCEKLRKRQAILDDRIIALERKRYEDELLREREKLLILEEQRRKEKDSEMELFKTLLYTIAEKQGVKISLNYK